MNSAPMNPLTNTIRLLAAALDAVGIPYAIGGSVASSVRGIARMTLDLDIVAAIRANQAEPLAASLGGDWYADPRQMRDAIQRGRAFNVIYIPQGMKVDVFPATEDFHETQLARATKMLAPVLDEHVAYPVASAEDILLAKLRWYADGGEISDRQWNDIVGILYTNPALDNDYLNRWAARLGVSRLLARAIADATT